MDAGIDRTNCFVVAVLSFVVLSLLRRRGSDEGVGEAIEEAEDTSGMVVESSVENSLR